MGTRVLRREDPALLRGEGTYVDDLRAPELEGAVVLTYVRSPFAHARVESIDVDEALASPGVVAVFTARRSRPRHRCRRACRGSQEGMSRHLLAADTVRFVGEPVAIVVTETAAQGEDAAELVIVDYDPLDADRRSRAGARSGRRRAVPPRPAPTWRASSSRSARPPTCSPACDVVVSGRMVNQRLAAVPARGPRRRPRCGTAAG